MRSAWASTDKARCYVEYCCNVATHDVRDYGEGLSGPFDPASPVYEYRGEWGFCSQHLVSTDPA